MAYGVPTCAENRGGWAEMLEHGVTGMLGNSPQDIGRHAATLASNEDLRMAIATEARRRLETHIANPDLVWEQWRQVFGLPCETVYGVSPIQKAVPIVRDMQILQDAADQEDKPKVQEEPMTPTLTEAA